MVQLNLLSALASIIVIFCFYVIFREQTRRSLPLPPGPKKLPLLGNLLHMAKDLKWKTYHKWCKEFNSDIIHLDIAGTSIIVLDTFEVATELLERRSSRYSGRATLPMVNGLMGREHRRLMHHSFHPSAAVKLRPHELKATHHLLRKLLDDPGIDGLMGHLRHMIVETIVSITYGIEVLPEGDPYIKNADDALKPLVIAGIPGTFLVDAFPILRIAPDWMPFADFKRKAKEWRMLARRMVDTPFNAAKRNIELGGAPPSFTSISLGNMDENGDLERQETVIKNVAGAMYTVISSCVLALMVNPDVLKKAQNEIDSVVGLGQLPGFEDEGSLPYIAAITKEALRWREVAPIAIPHFCDDEDEYNGYLIPAGSVVIPNSWAMLHDEKIYPDPFTFNPDRFMKDGKLNPAIKDPAHAAFGFGRRICPARYMAYSSVWIAIASLVATFDIKKPLDEKGQVIEPSLEFVNNLICMPAPFKCSMKPRSKEVAKVIRETAGNDYFVM
ncbi:cytochrome P450 [Collybia nuda]|uniref:Cytochrome P450 n=1 Tax=Collybia nuda TaxID=64659 RepID=A0A9P5XVR1_9AGAR|nr:cytochrome P450 [Collybia nuda]